MLKGEYQYFPLKMARERIFPQMALRCSLLITLSGGQKASVYLFLRQLRDVVHSSVRLNLGVKMVDDGP